ncbi:hypothetical protein DV515_00007745 [Chloebia gouldiae]|uniref:Uncharacterized protein n=1 Tax=Chloebia gouldiae TaxID=44316 RepID=A0A3L8SGN0_CHLGU|nr:hypothetical protein DV515_00007745 [Chloebia gouldiae]
MSVKPESTEPQDEFGILPLVLLCIITCFESSEAFEIRTPISRAAACALASPSCWRSLAHSVDNQG